MARGLVAIAIFQAAVLKKLPEADRVLGREIFDLKDEQVVTSVYPLLHGFMIGLILSLTLIHLYYGAKALEKSPLFLTITLAATCIAGAIWLLKKIYYRPKLRKLEAEFQKKSKDPHFQRVSEKIVRIGKEIQSIFHL